MAGEMKQGSYVGQMKDGKRNGKGVWKTLDNRESYSGDWVNDLMEGQGVYIWDNDDAYHGGWKAGKMHGYGIQAVQVGDGKEDVYSGNFEKGVPNGFGKKVFASGDVHEGMYLNDQRHGYGTYTWADGSVYVGEWAYGTMSGKGTKRMPDGSSYSGDWVNGQACGIGTKVYPNGDVHEGEYKNDVRDGYGIYRWANEETFEGYWKAGMKHGEGTEYLRGLVSKGVWANGQKHGVFTASIGGNGGKTYEQTWKNGIPKEEREIPYVSPDSLKTQKKNELAKLQAEVERLREILESKEEEKEKTTCSVCFSAATQCVLDPCGHICLCMGCSKGLVQCPICRANIQKTIRIFRA